MKYYLYVISRNATFTLPIHVLFFQSRGLSLAEIGVVEAVFTATILVAESPTGYVSDRIGRRNALLVSTVLMGAGAAAFALADSFWMFAVVIAVRGVAHTFQSGTDGAWFYDRLLELDDRDEDDYARLTGRAESLGKLMAGLAAVVGSGLYEYDPVFPFLLEGALVGTGALVVLTMEEPSVKNDDDEPPLTVRRATSIVRETLSKRELSSFVLYTGLLVGVLNTIDIFVQPVSTDVLGIDPKFLGLLYGSFMVLSAAVSSQAGRIKDVVGIKGWFTGAPILLAVTMLGVSTFPPLALVVFFLARGTLTASSPLLHQYVNDHSGSTGRATVLSAASMIRTFFVAPLNVLGGALATAVLLPTALTVLGGILLGGCVAIMLWRFPVVEGETAAA